jgi:arabinogalactan endo-1,4-beta-galactosidase
MKKAALLLTVVMLGGLLSGCSPSESENSSYELYSNEGRTNSEEYDYDNIIVNAPTNTLSDDFAYGVDASIVSDVEKNGGVYYNENGDEEDVFKIFKNDGVNYVRFRLWVDPHSASGEDYGGGTNDLDTDIALAKRANAAGLKVMVDFHYSDFWSDPSHYWCPKSWSSVTKANLPDQVATYTKESLEGFKTAGVTVSSVQIGNEINPGIAGVVSGTGTGICAKMIAKGITAAKEVYPEVKTIVHLTNIKSTKAIYQYLSNLQSNGADFDICGFSYYPYWHGTKDNLQTVLNTAASTTGKPVMIVETAWGFTDEQNDNCVNQYSTSSFGKAGGYLTSPQGQATEIADLVDVLSKVPNQMGQGIFYWEPDWLPVSGTNWATKAGQYYNDKGIDGTGSYTDASCLESWANQAWFSYSGKALPSASVYKHIQNKDKCADETVTGLVDGDLTLTANLKGTWSMPSTVQAYTNTGAYRDLEVTWNSTEVAAITEDGEYVVHGTTKDGSLEVTCTVTAESNFVQDYSFENQAMTSQEAAVTSPWSMSDNTDYGNYGTGHIESKGEGNLDGSKYFHWYNSVAFTFTLEQTLTVDWAGKYRLRTYIMANSGGYTSFDLWIKVGNGDKQSVSILDSCVGWNSDLKSGMKEVKIENVEIPAGSSVTFGLSCVGGAASWGHNDLWSLVKTGSLA